jgi:hypothetical protein
VSLAALGSLLLGVVMLAVFALILGSVHTFRRKADRRRGWLKLTAALVLLGNVLIWSL